ncbi:TonB-dependent receptor [Spirosoma litoris]
MKHFTVHFFRSACLIVLLLAICFLPASAQTKGVIRGKIVDDQGGALPGASVRIKGTTQGTVTNLTGDYTLSDITPGTINLEVFYMGFQPYDQPVSVTTGETTVHNITLASTTTMLKGVTVTGIMEGQQKALNQQRNADNFKQIVSADLMGRFPDLNVAESLQRLPGVTIGREQNEGSTVQLRGTPGNYTNINMNGEQIMGTQEQGQRNAQLDLIPANVLSSMEVVKTLTSDLDGDAIAGAINMKTPTAISLKPRISIDLAAGYNKLRDKTNGIVNLSYNQRFFQTDKSPNGKLGLALYGSYYRTNNGYDEINAQVWQSKDFNDGQGSILFPTDIRIIHLNNLRTRKGLTATIDYSFNPTASIVFNATYTDLDNDAVRYRKRTRMQTANTTRTTDGIYTTTRGRGYNEYMNRSIDNGNFNMSLEGEKQFSRLKLDAGLFYTTSKLKQLANTFNYVTGNVPLTISQIAGDYIQATGSTDAKNNASLYTFNTYEANNFNSEGTNFVGRLNATYNYKIGANDAYFKAGLKMKRMHNKRYRPSYSTSTYNGPAATGNLTNFLGAAELDDKLLDNNLTFGRAVDGDATVNFFNSNPNYFPANASLNQVAVDTYFYDAEEDVTSGYVMNRIQFKKLMLLGGLRIESTSVDYNAQLVNQDASGNLTSSVPTNAVYNYTKFLPNLQAKYDVGRNTIARGALSFGYSRPNFNELVPSRVVSILNATLTDGNPDLKPAATTNYDISLEHYLKNLGILSVGGFYKHITNFQYNSVVTLTGTEFPGANNYLNYQYYKTYNGDVATVYGLEVNAQTNLTFLPGFLKGFSLYANYTYVYSKADAQLRKGLRLPGQATNTANGSLSYTYKGFTVQGNVNYNGSYTVLLGVNDANDVIRAERVQVDANASYRITKNFTIYAEGTNLLNSPQTDYLGIRSRIYEKQFYDYTGRAGIKYRF